jgi:septal ring factor EnvC (AmiA/AmiB activator)
MIRAAALCLCLIAPAAQAGVAEDAAAAAAALQASVQALQEAEGGKDRVASLTATIRAYEEGLAALREALRQAELRQEALELRFQTERDRIAQLLGVLSSINAERSGMMLADVTPALQAEAERLRADLTELNDLRTLQLAAGKTLSEGLAAAQDARSALSQAISDRTDLPRRFTEDPEVLKGLLESADTLDAFATGLALDDTGSTTFSEAKGSLAMPVLGKVLLMPNETDARGVTRPGLTLATRPGALVVSPWAATIRYTGPLLDYGNVMILEPGGGYLLVLTGLEQVYGEVGEVVARGAALGLMGARDHVDTDFLADAAEGGGIEGTETLYMELRQGADAVNPTEWFAGLAEAKE